MSDDVKTVSAADAAAALAEAGYTTTGPCWGCSIKLFACDCPRSAMIRWFMLRLNGGQAVAGTDLPRDEIYLVLAELDGANPAVLKRAWDRRHTQMTVFEALDLLAAFIRSNIHRQRTFRAIRWAMERSYVRTGVTLCARPVPVPVVFNEAQGEEVGQQLISLCRFAINRGKWDVLTDMLVAIPGPVDSPTIIHPREAMFSHALVAHAPDEVIRLLVERTDKVMLQMTTAMPLLSWALNPRSPTVVEDGANFAALVTRGAAEDGSGLDVQTLAPLWRERMREFAGGPRVDWNIARNKDMAEEAIRMTMMRIARYRPLMIKAVREGLGAAMSVDVLVRLVGEYVMRPVPTVGAAAGGAVVADAGAVAGAAGAGAGAAAAADTDADMPTAP